LITAIAVVVPEARADPALKPNYVKTKRKVDESKIIKEEGGKRTQPIQRKQAPTMAIGSELAGNLP